MCIIRDVIKETKGIVAILICIHVNILSYLILLYKPISFKYVIIFASDVFSKSSGRLLQLKYF